MLPQAVATRARPRIGRYLITGRIGRGGMGMVYRGLDEALEREVAVKTLHAEGTLDADSRRRFEIEAKAAARLQHPNIVTVYELGEDRGIPFIAMELLPGVDLEALLRSGEPLPLVEKLDVVAQVCRGLAYAHERGIVHRDIKPTNVRLLEDGTAKIMDFGIAKLGGTHLTKTGMMIGTVNYMSPEQVRGKPLDGRSDVFSVGVILYEMLAGERPFRAEGPTQVLYKIVNEEPPPPDLSAAGGLAPRLQEILGRALAKDRGPPLPRGRRARRRPRRRPRGRAGGGSARAGGSRPRARRGPPGPARGARGRGRGPAAQRAGRAPGLPRGPPAPADGAAGREAPARAGRPRHRGLPRAGGDLPGRSHPARPLARGPRPHPARADRDEHRPLVRPGAAPRPRATAGSGPAAPSWRSVPSRRPCSSGAACPRPRSRCT